MHLVVFANGLQGMPENFGCVMQKLNVAATISRVKLLLFAPPCNKHTKTFQGIDVAGRRLYEAVRAQIHCMNQDRDQSKHAMEISFVGHSLGGLINRYAAFLLDQAHYFDGTVRPVLFITLASPHVGSLQQMKWGEELLGKMSRTLNQLLFRDRDDHIHNNNPLLFIMSTEPFLSALRKFERCIIYANMNGDITVAPNTSSVIDVCLVNPGRSLRSKMSVMHHWTQPEYLAHRANALPFVYDNPFANATMTNLQILNLERVLIHAPRALAHIDVIMMFGHVLSAPGLPIVSDVVSNFVS